MIVRVRFGGAGHVFTAGLFQGIGRLLCPLRIVTVHGEQKVPLDRETARRLQAQPCVVCGSSAGKRCKARTNRGAGTLARGPAQGASRKHVKMDVKDGLTCFAIRVEHGAESALGVPVVFCDRRSAPDH